MISGFPSGQVMLSFQTIIVVSAVLLAVTGFFILRSWRSPRSIPLSFSVLRDISSQGHYAMFIEGVPVSQELSENNHVIKLALFRLVPSSTEFDDKAVSVFFGPHLVGRMSRNDAAAYRMEHGEEETKCRGIYSVSDGVYNVWLDVNIGSGVLGASSIMQTQELREVFQIPTLIQQREVGVVAEFLANSMVRIFDANLTPGESGVEVFIDGFVMAHLSEEMSDQFISRHGSKSVKTLALVRRTVDGPNISLLANNQLNDLLIHPDPENQAV